MLNLISALILFAATAFAAWHLSEALWKHRGWRWFAAAPVLSLAASVVWQRTSLEIFRRREFLPSIWRLFGTPHGMYYFLWSVLVPFAVTVAAIAAFGMVCRHRAIRSEITRKDAKRISLYYFFLILVNLIYTLLSSLMATDTFL
jgi:hypothetical protein